MKQTVEATTTKVDLTKKVKVVFCGKEIEFATKAELEINGTVVKLMCRQLISKLDKKSVWTYNVDGFTFETYKGVDERDNYTNILKDGKMFITNLAYQSVKRIAEAKKWNESKMHTEYLRAVGRIASKVEVVKGSM